MAYWHIGGGRGGHRESVGALRAADLGFLLKQLLVGELLVFGLRGGKYLVAGHCGAGSALLIDGSSQEARLREPQSLIEVCLGATCVISGPVS